MANIKIPRKKFEKEIGKLDEKMQNKIAMFGTTLESFDDKEIELEIFPNRPDLLSFQGFKRAFLAFLNKKIGLKEYKINSPEKNFKVTLDHSLKNIRPYTACAIIKNIKLDNEKIKEIVDIQEKLHSTIGRKRKKIAIGIYPLEKIKLPIKFKAMEPDKIKFIPLETQKEMSGLQILQRHPTGREYAHLLAGKTKFPVFLDANNDVLSMPPIINSQLTGKITEETKELFIECSGFDFKSCKKCLNIITTTFAEMGGKIYQMELKINSKKEITPDLNPSEKSISKENINKLLGTMLTEKQIKNFLEMMGHKYEKGKVKTPAWRNDILHEVDLIEDIAIAHGYENFIPELPSISTIGEENKKEILKRKISQILSGLGFLEVSNYHLTKKQDQFDKMDILEKEKKHFLETIESKTEYNILRKDLSHYIMKIFSENNDSEYPQKIFETGRVFYINEKDEIQEEEKISGGVAPGNFTELKQTLNYLAKILDIKIEYKEPELKEIPKHFIEGRTAKIIINSKTQGFIGEIHPKILKKWKIKMPISLFEISLEEINNLLI
jgi:phenylalanyl-tRNA synthetase beta chain